MLCRSKKALFFCKNNLYRIWTIEPFDRIALRVLSFSKWVWREDIRTFLQCSDVPSLTNLNRSSENCHLSTFPSLVFQCLFLKMQVAICRQRISVHCSLSSNRAKCKGETRNQENNPSPRGTSLFVFTRKAVFFSTTIYVCIKKMHFHDLGKAFLFSMKPLRR